MVIFRKKQADKTVQFNTEKVFLAATQPLKLVYGCFCTIPHGLSEEDAEERFKSCGENKIVQETRPNPLLMPCKTFINPFIGILMALVLVSLVLDVWMARPEEREWTSILVIGNTVVLSVVLRFSQEWRSGRASDALQKMVKNIASVIRSGGPGPYEINIIDLVPGDTICLAAGDVVPVDVRVAGSKDLFISQSSLTGESDTIEKCAVLTEDRRRPGSVIELDDIYFMSSNIVSGSIRAIVLGTGRGTYLNTTARSIIDVRAQTAFDKGISNVSFLLIRFMPVMVPLVFLINGVAKGDWFEAFIFAISVAVGLAPEMLPMIVAANLSKGAVSMAKKETIVKNLNAIQNFGTMDILCTDKTGTLTRDHIVLEKLIDVDGSEDHEYRVLRRAYFNSYFQTGLKSLMDRAISSHVRGLQLNCLRDACTKIDEVPFDFTRRRTSVVVEDEQRKRQIITEGAVEEMLAICTRAELGKTIHELTDELRWKAFVTSEQMSKEGMHVPAVAQRSWVEKEHDFSVGDESEMVLIGYLAFFDPPKPSAASAVRQLHSHGVDVKVLPSDNEAVVRTICRQVGVDTTCTLNGTEIKQPTDEELKLKIRQTTVFAKLAPMQKTRVITLLQELGHMVGFLGDGINGASAPRQSDVGISVDTAIDIAKGGADIILLEEDLMVLEDGAIKERRTLGSIMKYTKTTASSNFGNMFSMLAVNAFLPFLPMLPVHLFVQNLLYDTSQSTIPFDRMDPEYLMKPRKRDASNLGRFMIFIGPVNSVFDIALFPVIWCMSGYNSPEHQTLFQSGWFVESLLSRMLIVHMIRTRKIPFIQSTAPWPISGLTSVIMVLGIITPFIQSGASIGLIPLLLSYFPWLASILLGYCVLTQLIKQWYVKRLTRRL